MSKLHRHVVKPTSEELRVEAHRYGMAHSFLMLLNTYKSELTPDQMKMLRGKALSGDIDGAMQGLDTLAERRYRADGSRVW